MAVQAAPRKAHISGSGCGQARALLEGRRSGRRGYRTKTRSRSALSWWTLLLKEWTTGDAHDVTDRTFVVRRVIRINDSLPGDKLGHWVWQRGPWLMVDRVTGRVTALKLPDYDPGVSQVSWFRDYGAYCGVTATGKSLYAVVAQLAARKPVLAKKLAAFDPENHPDPACDAPDWQREPLRITFHPSRQGCSELRYCSRFGGAGGGLGRRRGDAGRSTGAAKVANCCAEGSSKATIDQQ